MHGTFTKSSLRFEDCSVVLLGVDFWCLALEFVASSLRPKARVCGFMVARNCVVEFVPTA